MTKAPPSLYDINFARKRALVRVDFNVPLDDDLNVVDDSRIVAALPTLKKIIADGGSCVVISHLGRPKGKAETRFSLKNIISTVEKNLGLTLQFSNTCVGDEAQGKAAALKPGEVLLLENLRFFPEEKGSDLAFAKQLAQLGDVYVNDAFGAAHRIHTSVTLVAQFFKEKCIGAIMHQELINAKRLLESTEKPFLAIVGGAKIADKIVMIDRLLDRVDQLIIGGGMAYTFCKAGGGEVGKSLVENSQLPLAKGLMDKAKAKGIELYLPIDSVIADKIDTEAHTAIASSSKIEAPWMGLDIGPEAQRIFSTVILQAKTILWNGPMGVFEMKNFAGGTKAVGEAVAMATDKGAFSLVGGGESAAATKRFGLSHRMSYVSTGGGALLAYFEGKPLPAIEALKSE